MEGTCANLEEKAGKTQPLLTASQGQEITSQKTKSAQFSDKMYALPLL